MVSEVQAVASGLLALSDRGAGVPLRELALVGLTAAIITYFATGWVRVLATRLGAVAYPRERDVHLQPTPRMGGLAMYIGVVAAVLLASQLPALTRGFVYSSGMPAVVVAGGLIMAIGLIDDQWGLDALTKFAGQITAASVLVTMGVAWSVLYIPIGGVGTIVLDQVSSILLTLALTVSIVNAMNFVDGLDGLAAGLGPDHRAGHLHLLGRPAARSRRRRSVLPARGDLGGAGRRVPGIPAAQLPPRQDLHGRLGLDAHRADAGRRRPPRRPGRSRRPPTAPATFSRCCHRSCWWSR